jgi:integrase/recombinase XerD
VKTYLDGNEIEKLEAAATNLRDRLLARLLFRLGCRVSECLGLEEQHIDFNAQTVMIQHLKTRMRLDCPECGRQLSRRSVFCPGCGSRVEQAVNKAIESRKMRSLPVDPETIVMLREYIQGGGPVIKSGKRLIFGINRHRAWQIVKGCAERAGLPKLVNPETGKVHNVSPHRLRDAFAVHAVKLNDSGDGLRMLQEHLGHASFNTTARYRKVAGDEHRVWYEQLWKKDVRNRTPGGK